MGARVMKTSLRVRPVPFLAMVIVLIIAFTAIALAAEPTVELGTTSEFAILAGSTITNTGPTTINGDVGLHPGSAFVDTGVTLNGTAYIADAVASQAKSDLVTAYDDAAGRPVTGAVPVDLGGQVLTPGVYSSGGVLGITGTLTLDAEGDPDAVFIFKSTATLITASNSSVVLINGARPCRVFWVVPSSATLATSSSFVGTIFAMTDIGAQTGATVVGQLLARNGQVTLDTNTITNAACESERVIAISKEASTSSLPESGGEVTYTYTVTNPGTVQFSDVIVTDDMISPVTYASGDTNEDEILQPGEVWIYTATDTITETTTNIGTVTGVGAGVETSDTDSATVTVAPASTTGDVEIVKTASRNTLPVGGGSVTYTYAVTNLGSVDATNVMVTDDKINTVTYVSGDLNDDEILQPSETWIYTATAELTATTTNVGTVSANSGEDVAVDTDSVTVTVTQAESKTDTEVRGDLLPRTATPWYNLMLGGTVLMLLGAAGLVVSRGHV